MLDQRREFEGPTYEPDKERPQAAKPISAAPDIPTGVPKPVFKRDFAASYRRIAGRHATSFGIMRNGRQLAIGNNLGLVHFKIEQNILHAIQELHAVFPYELDLRQPDAPEDHQPFTVHKARLAGAPGEKRPALPGDPV